MQSTKLITKVLLRQAVECDQCKQNPQHSQNHMLEGFRRQYWKSNQNCSVSVHMEEIYPLSSRGLGSQSLNAIPTFFKQCVQATAHSTTAPYYSYLCLRGPSILPLFSQAAQQMILLQLSAFLSQYRHGYQFFMRLQVPKYPYPSSSILLTNRSQYVPQCSLHACSVKIMRGLEGGSSLLRKTIRPVYYR